MNDPIKDFKEEVQDNINRQGNDENFIRISKEWMVASIDSKYSYNFSWLGRPIIQYPQDIVAMQEIIWRVQPDLIIETGIAHGGSLIFYASLLKLLECFWGGKHRVLGVDIDIREHNRREIEMHPLHEMITMIQGASIDEGVIKEVGSVARDYNKILVVLDSNHTHEHVLEECRKYGSFVSRDSYLVVMDTVTEMYQRVKKERGIDVPKYNVRSWSEGNNPFTAVVEFLKENDCFVLDEEIGYKLMLSVAGGGYLKRIKVDNSNE